MAKHSIKHSESGLRLLDDRVLDPAFDSDEFNHQVYANILAKIFHPNSGNKPGISVALFGKWGQGKSSIVRLMEAKLAEDSDSALPASERPKVIWFNAWKTRGDHVRRQLLLTILKGIDSPNYEKLAKFIQPGIPVCLRPFEEQTRVHDSTKFIAFLKEEWGNKWGRFFLLLGVGSLALFITSLFFPSWHQAFSGLSILGIMGWLLSFVSQRLKKRNIQILASAEPVSDSQRLRFPEQFQLVFEEELARYKERSGRPIIVVVDDLDRCEVRTVAEALSCIRQLGGDSGFKEEIAECRFLVPCDEAQVVDALSKDGHHSGYHEDELLRKFFDAVVRMDDFIPVDMVAYAENALKQAVEVSDDELRLIQELVGAVAPRNPREVKRLTNAFLVFREKMDEMRQSQTLRKEEKLPDFERTLLFAIAIQETTPSEYTHLANDPKHFEWLRKPGNAENQTNQAKRATRILSSLEPVSARTLRLLTRKGIPEILRGVNNGAEIYDAVLSGDRQAFATAVSEEENISSISAWLKQHRQSIHTIAQFRYALSCLLGVESPPPRLLEAVSSFMEFPRLTEGVSGFDMLVPLALICPRLDSPARERAINAIFTRFNTVEDGQILGSTELSAMLALGRRLPNSMVEQLTKRVSLLLKTGDPGTARSNLLALRQNLEAVPVERFTGFAPKLALEISKSCSWEFYSDSDPSDVRLHTDAIVALIGNESDNLGHLIESLSAGPLNNPVNLEQQPEGPWKEAFLTARSVAIRLTDEGAQHLFQILEPWLSAQPQHPPSGLRSITEALLGVILKLPQGDMETVATILTDSSMSADDPEWLCDIVKESLSLNSDRTEPYKALCKAIFKRVGESHLLESGPSVSARQLLNNMARREWDLAQEADQLFASAIDERIEDESSWEDWKETLWPLCGGQTTQTVQATYRKIGDDLISSSLVPFAVTELSGNQIGRTLQLTLKTYFRNPSSLDNSAFTSLFQDGGVNGTDQILTFVVEDWDAGQMNLDDAQVHFVALYCPISSQDTFQNRIRVEYLQSAELERFSVGVKLIQMMDSPTTEVLDAIRERGTEHVEVLSSGTISGISELLGEDIVSLNQSAEVRFEEEDGQDLR